VQRPLRSAPSSQWIKDRLELVGSAFHSVKLGGPLKSLMAAFKQRLWKVLEQHPEFQNLSAAFRTNFVKEKSAPGLSLMFLHWATTSATNPTLKDLDCFCERDAAAVESLVMANRCLTADPTVFLLSLVSI
jgi:hypothetical protein